MFLLETDFDRRNRGDTQDDSFKSSVEVFLLANLQGSIMRSILCFAFCYLKCYIKLSCTKKYYSN